MLLAIQIALKRRPLNRNMNRTRNETILAQEQLHPAIFILPVFAALVMGLPTFFVLLMIHVFMAMFTTLMAQFTNLQITLFNGYFYFFASLPTIFLTGIVFLVTLVAYLKSQIALTNRRTEEIVAAPPANLITVPDSPS